MKIKSIALGIIAILIISGGIVAIDAGNNNSGPKPGIDFNGPHFNLNLIGKDKEMPGDYDNPDRHTMFVPLDSTDMTFPINQDNNLPGNPSTMQGIRIDMTQSTSEDGWAVIDGDATDGYGAFELAAGKYWVYIAVKAKSPKFENAYTDITGWVEAYDNLGALWYYVPIGTVTVQKNGKWTDATGLFFVTDAEDPFGFNEISGITQVPGYGIWVFDYMAGLDTWYENSGETAPYDFSNLAYFWQLVNSGNKLIQVRFYPMD